MFSDLKLSESDHLWPHRLEFITNRSQEGSQFCKGFGGIGGILRWQVDFVAMEEYDNEDDDDWGY